MGLGIGYIESRSLLKMLRGMESKAKISDIDSTNMITKLSISVYLPTLFIHGFGIIGLAETLVYFLAPGTFAEFWSMYSYRVIGLGIFFGLVEGYLLTGQFRRDWMSEDQELNEAS